MTRRRRSIKEAAAVKLQLAEIIKRQFDHNGQIITHDELAREHVARNGSVTAAEDVQVYGGPAVVYLRNEFSYAIVPITARIDDFDGEPRDEAVIADAVAGLGAGGPRVGWYHPTGQDDWLWVYYIGHLGRAGVAAVFHAAQQVDANPALITARGRARIAGRTALGDGAPGKTEARIINARLADGR